MKPLAIISEVVPNLQTPNIKLSTRPESKREIVYEDGPGTMQSKSEPEYSNALLCPRQKWLEFKTIQSLFLCQELRSAVIAGTAMPQCVWLVRR